MHSFFGDTNSQSMSTSRRSSASCEKSKPDSQGQSVVVVHALHVHTCCVHHDVVEQLVALLRNSEPT